MVLVIRHSYVALLVVVLLLNNKVCEVEFFGGFISTIISI